MNRRDGSLRDRLRGALAALSLLVSAAALAAPITYTFTIANAAGTANGTPFDVPTLTVALQADTAQIVPTTVFAVAGNCVAALSGSAAAEGVSVALAPPLFVCAAADGTVIYVGPTSGAANPPETFIVGGFAPPPGGSYNLASNYPLASNLPTELAGGATLNTSTATIFLTDATAVSFAAALTGTNIPALGSAPLAGLSLLVAFLALVRLRRR